MEKTYVKSEFDENGRPDMSNFSTQLINHWNRANYETWIDVCHAVWPNPDFNPSKLEAKFKRFRSYYWEKGIGNNSNNEVFAALREDKFLRQSGYDFFPVLAPRWEVSGEDVYGTDCPGMTSLGDIRQLMTGEKRSMLWPDF